MEQLRSDLSTNPPLEGAYTPKKGDNCASKFVDGEWYRARVEKIEKNKITMLYIDYGNVSTSFLSCCRKQVLAWRTLKLYIAGLVANYGISNTIVLEIP